MYDLVVTGKIVGREKIFEAQIGIENGIIKEIKKGGLKGEESIKALSNSLIFPGFIDPHVHLREDASRKWNYKEDFLTGSKAAAHGGVTTVFDMPNNPLPAVTRERVKEKIELAKKAIIDVLFYGGIQKQFFYEIERMAQSVIGYKLYLAETTGQLLLSEDSIQEAVRLIAKTNLPSSFHFEENSMIVEKVLSLTKEYKFHAHVAHLSTERILETVKEFKRKKYPVTFEVTPHHVIFDKINSKKISNVTMNPPVRERKQRMALIQALKNGEVDMIGSDHAPHTLEDKEKGAKGVPNLDIYGNFISFLIDKVKLNPVYVAQITSLNVAKLFGLKDKGEIREGMIANVAILNFNKEIVKSETHFTKCGWSPYEGMEFPGRISHTIHHGKILYF